MADKSNSLKKLGKVKDLELNEAYQKVLEFFFSFPTVKIGLSDLAKKINISKTTANRVVERLIREGFLNKNVIGKTWQIYCDQKHIYNYSRKVARSYSMVYEAGIIDLVHKEIPNPQAIILFGSYQKGDDTEESDIDIAVEVLGDKEMQIIERGKFAKFGLRKDVKLNLHVFSRNKIDLNLFSNIANGIVLDGFLEVRP